MFQRIRLACLAVVLTVATTLAAGLSNTVEDSVLNWAFKQTAFPSAPTTLCFGLSATDPGDTCANEISGGSYARACLTPDANSSTHTNYNSLIDSGTARQVSNKAEIAFPAATADWNTGSAIKWWFAISSSSGAGTCYLSGAVNGSTGVIVLNGNTLKFTAGTPGQLTFTID